MTAADAIREMRAISDVEVWKRPKYALDMWADAIEAELKEDEALRDRMRDILVRTASALKGEPKPLHLHDWSDLPEVAKAKDAEIARLRAVDVDAILKVAEEIESTSACTDETSCGDDHRDWAAALRKACGK